jgi:pyridinium-3,5-biscarboxylic acid mononucleotide synthase
VTVRYDYGRAARVGLPEAVLCMGKTDDHLRIIAVELMTHPDVAVLFTRMTPEQADVVREVTGPALDYDVESSTAFLNGQMPGRPGAVAVVTAGTSDLTVAAEVVRTLTFLGITSRLIADVGVAGLWRLQERLDELTSSHVVVTVAGMDAALASVVGGLVGNPVIAVPTSTGYGAAQHGQTALNAMLVSCAQGVLVTNIDNGFGAACAAARILQYREAT